MLYHVWERCKRSTAVQEVYIATCDDEIREAATAFGAQVIMTSKEHVRATDRVAEAAKNLDCDAVVMVQGDEPLVDSVMIGASLDTVIRHSCVNVIQPLAAGELSDRDTIKVVLAYLGRIIYMTRSPLPAEYKQVCVIAFTKASLLEYPRLAPTPLEKEESIDMMRLIEWRRPIYSRLLPNLPHTHAVDRPKDVPIVEEMLRLDSRS